jgi:hypothetical protein
MATGIVVPDVFRAAANTGCIGPMSVSKVRKTLGAARTEPAPARVREVRARSPSGSMTADREAGGSSLWRSRNVPAPTPARLSGDCSRDERKPRLTLGASHEALRGGLVLLETSCFRRCRQVVGRHNAPGGANRQGQLGLATWAGRADVAQTGLPGGVHMRGVRRDAPFPADEGRQSRLPVCRIGSRCTWRTQDRSRIAGPGQRRSVDQAPSLGQARPVDQAPPLGQAPAIDQVYSVPQGACNG